MQHPEILLELMRQRQSELLLEAECRRSLQAASEQPGGVRQSILSLVFRDQLPWDRPGRVTRRSSG